MLLLWSIGRILAMFMHTSLLLLRLLQRDDDKKQILIPALTTFTAPWSWEKIWKLILALRLLHREHDKKNIIFQKKRTSPYCHYVHYAMVVSKNMKFHFTTTLTTSWPIKKDKFSFLLRNNFYHVHYVGERNKNIYFFISILHSPRRDHEKEIMFFLPIATTFTTPWFWQKNIVLLLLLRSLRPMIMTEKQIIIHSNTTFITKY